MVVLLTVLSGLALIVFLTVLLALLGRIRGSLARINVSMSKIAMGVRAIEVETAILPAELPATAAGLTQITEGAEIVAGVLASADGHLAKLAPMEA